MYLGKVFEPVVDEGWVCDFGDEDGCLKPVRWVTYDTAWVVPMFACDDCMALYQV
jgi:hypothetical protein